MCGICGRDISKTTAEIRGQEADKDESRALYRDKRGRGQRCVNESGLRGWNVHKNALPPYRARVGSGCAHVAVAKDEIIPIH